MEEALDLSLDRVLMMMMMMMMMMMQRLHDFRKRKKVIEHKMCVLISSTTQV